MELVPVLSIIVILIVIAGFVFIIPIGTWFQANSSGLNISLAEFIGMIIRKTDPKPIVEAAIKLKKAGIRKDITELESLVLAGGNIDRVTNAFIESKRVGINVDFKYITALEFSGNDPEKAILEYEQPKELEENNLSFSNKNNEKYVVSFKTLVIRSKDNPQSLSLSIVVDYIKKYIEDEIYNTGSEPIDVDSLTDKIKNDSVEETAIDILELKIYIKEPLRF